MESNSVCNHKSDFRNRTTAKWESDLLITRITTDKTLDDKKACYQLVTTMKKFEKETRHRLYVFIKTKNNSLLGEMRDNSAHMTRSVHSHRHDALTVPLMVLLHCSITNMTCTLSY